MVYTKWYMSGYAYFTVVGQQIIDALENGVSRYPTLEGRFPQVSGIAFGFDPTKPPGQRINPRHVKVQGSRIRLDEVVTSFFVWLGLICTFYAWFSYICLQLVWQKWLVLNAVAVLSTVYKKLFGWRQGWIWRFQILRTAGKRTLHSSKR